MSLERKIGSNALGIAEKEFEAQQMKIGPDTLGTVKNESRNAKI
jgi:hypothetical protein